MSLAYVLINAEIGKEKSCFEEIKGISNIPPTILPTDNTNGVGIHTVGFNTTTKDASVTLSVGYSTAGSFPFEVGDKVLIENELMFIEKHWPKNLPSGVIHADIFQDYVWG